MGNKTKSPVWAALIPNGALFAYRPRSYNGDRNYRIYWNKNFPREWQVRYADNGVLICEDYSVWALNECMKNGSLLDGKTLGDWEELAQGFMPSEDEDIDVEILI